MDITELSRLVENLIRVGTIHSVDHAAVRCRVQTGKLVTQWLPWLERRAGETTTWDPPTVGEQCIVFSPSGEPASGLVLVGIHSALIKPPSHSPDTHVTRYPDGGLIEYDHALNEYRLTVPDGGRIVLTIGATTLELRGDGTTLTTPDFDGVQS